MSSRIIVGSCGLGAMLSRAAASRSMPSISARTGKSRVVSVPRAPPGVLPSKPAGVSMPAALGVTMAKGRRLQGWQTSTAALPGRKAVFRTIASMSPKPAS